MVKRALLQAQKGGAGNRIVGLRTLGVPRTNNSTDDTNSATTTATENVSGGGGIEPEKAKRKLSAASSHQKQQQQQQQQRQQRQQRQQQESLQTLQNKTSVPRPKSALIEGMYGTQQAAKKRRIMETKTLDKVTSVREAFEVCLFKAERSQGDFVRNKHQLNELLSHLSALQAKKAKRNEIARVEEQVRQLRAQITTARTAQQTPIDVLVNVAKFSLQNCAAAAKSNKRNHVETQQQEKEQKQEEKAQQQQQQHETRPTKKRRIGASDENAKRQDGTTATLCVTKSMQQVLQRFVQVMQVSRRQTKSCFSESAAVTLPPLRYNWRDEFATAMAQQIAADDSVYPLHWQLASVDALLPPQSNNNCHKKDKDDDDKEDDNDVKEEDEDDDDDDDDDLFDDTARNDWLSANKELLQQDNSACKQTAQSEMCSAIEAERSRAFVLHSRSQTHEQFRQQNSSLLHEAAERVAERVMSLFFQQPDQKQALAETAGLFASEQHRQQLAEQNQPLCNNSQQKEESKPVAIVRIGQLKKSAAIGGKSRNRVRNKMKPARNTENVSIFNFLHVKAQQMSEKHVQAARFIEFMQLRERELGNAEHNADSMFSAFASEQEQQQRLETLRRNQQKAHGSDCQNAAEHLPLPNYENPSCPRCNSAVHVSSRTGMETCTSPQCAYAVYMATGFDVVHLEQQVHNTYQYLLVVHMKSTLRRVQGKESAMVPHRIKNAVRERLEMERADLKRVTPKKVKKVLKDLNLQAWYNHRHKICAAITGRKPYQFSSEEEDVILAVFERLIEPYNLYRPKTDENFPYYRYALHKILQLLGYPANVLCEFSTLKARKNHRRKEAIWAKMMKYRGWPYYKS